MKGVTTLNNHNTNFTLSLFEHLKKQKFDAKYSFLKYHQNIVRTFIETASLDARGLLINHEMGMGKSILGIAIALDMMKEYSPIMLLTKSLQENMKGQIKKYVSLRAQFEPDYHLAKLTDAELSKWIEDHFDFVSLNAGNMLEQMARTTTDDLEAKLRGVLSLNSLEGKILIVDEAHNLFRAITNGSKNGAGLYDVVIKSKNLKIIFLTGTPIASDPFELVPCFNMLGSSRFRNLPEDYMEFKKLYVNADGTLRNKEKFQNRILGLTSYVDRLTASGSMIGIDDIVKTEFPKELTLIVEKVEMNRDQFAAYQQAKDRELDEASGKRPPPQLQSMTKPMGKSSSYKVHTRQISNYFAGTKASPKHVKILNNVNRYIGRDDSGPGVVYSQFTADGGLNSFARYLEEQGWENVQSAQSTQSAQSAQSTEHMDGMIDEPSLIERSLDAVPDEKLGSNEDPSDVYLENLWRGGYDNTEFSIIGAAVNATRNTPQFAIYTGALDITERQRIVNMFNSDDNMHGGVIDLLLISSVGAEGLDLKNVRHIHIMEPYWNWGRIAQVIARGVRNFSHIKLPAEQKDVQPYMYLAVSPDNPDAITTDVELYNESIKNMVAIQTFVDALKEVSIECLLSNPSSKCYVCSPTNKTLITPDATVDARANNPCSPVVEKEIKALSVDVDGVSYKYAQSDESIYGWEIYKLDKKLNVYIPVKEADPLFMTVYEKIEASK